MWGLLKGLPAFLLLLPQSACGLRTVPARIPSDLATDVYLMLSAGEPKFTAAAVAASAGCFLDRMKGYSINAPGYASGHQGANGLTVRASFINSTHVICHLPSVTTAGNSTLVLQAGGSACSTALTKLCPLSKLNLTGCWNCWRGTDHNVLKAAGCAKKEVQSYCGGPPPGSADPRLVGPGEAVAAEKRERDRVEGRAGSKTCASGPYQCAWFEHYVTVAVAVGRRPYIRESNGSIVIRADSEATTGLKLKLSTLISGRQITGIVDGGRDSAIHFPLTGLPPKLDELINITIEMPDGQIITRSRRFRRVSPPAVLSTVTVQVDHESGPGLLVNGIKHTSNGWFAGGWDHESSGLPISVTIPRNSTNSDLQRYYGQASLVTQWARQGVTFTRSGVNGGDGPWVLEDMKSHEEFWRHQMVLLDAAAAVGMSLLINAGFDHLAGCITGWGGGANHKGAECFVNGTAQLDVINRTKAWVWDTVERVKHHPAVAGYYACDDCCHVVRKEYAGKEYEALASIHQELFASHDPYHITFGTIACGETWLWQEDGFGLGMDVAMKEGYGGGIGSADFQPTGTPTKHQLRSYPMTFEPLWSMPDPMAKSSAPELRSAVYANTFGDIYDNNYYVNNPDGNADWLIQVAADIVSNEMAELLPAFRSGVKLSANFVQPIVRDITPFTDFSDPSKPKLCEIRARAFTEPPAAGIPPASADMYYCMHVVAVNAQTFPLMTKLLLDALGLPPAVVDGQRHLSIQRVFRGTEPTPINATVFPNGSASFSDIWDVQATNIYRIGCDPALISVPLSDDEMCIDNCDFELTNSWKPMMPYGSENGNTGKDYVLPVFYNLTDDRTWIRADPADPHQGRYSRRVNIPTAFPVSMPIVTQNLTKNGTKPYKVKFAARSSPAGLRIAAQWHPVFTADPTENGPPTPSVPSQQVLGTEWVEVEQQVVAKVTSTKPHYPALMLWIESPYETGGTVWVDSISVMS